MAIEHEYSIVGHKRRGTAFWLSMTSGAIAGLIVYFVQLAFVELEHRGLWQAPPVVLWPLTGAAIFGALYFLFDCSVWRWWGVNHLIGVPNFSGNWAVTGQTLGADGQPNYIWEATMLISQKYEKISIQLKTQQSSSQSITAAVVPQAGNGFRLIYSYRNDPRIGEPALQRHIGHCELEFDQSLTAATGDYFNNGGRTTFGRMDIRRSVNGTLGTG